MQWTRVAQLLWVRMTVRNSFRYVLPWRPFIEKAGRCSTLAMEPMQAGPQGSWAAAAQGARQPSLTNPWYGFTAQNQDPLPGWGAKRECPGDIIWLQIKALLQHRLSKKEGSCRLACWPHHCWRSLQTSNYHLEMIWPWDSWTGGRLEWPATPNSCPALRNKAGMNGSWRQKIITQPEVTPCEGGDTLRAIHNPIRATGIAISQPSWSPQHGVNFKCPLVCKPSSVTFENIIGQHFIYLTKHTAPTVHVPWTALSTLKNINLFSFYSNLLRSSYYPDLSYKQTKAQKFLNRLVASRIWTKNRSS